ncbi:hypothetical protein EPUS_05343 [Endocarpon pusillum Z07020]|uniref:Uncharacterized protein n=1 Tax=Endocarpon pusillum (strain Z07020 / HMAS-L-300199) TaxID=1263415 RepID=U1HTJ4_ENDPU|nr:uncharacterized protein EPUS_05343 [Endocarpon pusillum Z07020]ERF73920.1 hypothetical protein EPUS_05343 [Endocarpon pusillum Z07020]
METVQMITQPPPAVVRPDMTTVSVFDHIKEQLAAIPPLPSDHPQAVAPESSDTTATDPSQLSCRTQSANGSTQTPATSILLTSKLFFLSKVHVAPSLPVQDELELLWDKSIRARLRACLVHEITRGTCVQELMMAGRRADHLKPTIVVTCGDMKTRKRVQKVFKRQEWLQKLLKASDMLFVAAVEPTHLSSLNTSQRAAIGIGAGAAFSGFALLILTWIYRRWLHRKYVYHVEQEQMVYFPSIPGEDAVPHLSRHAVIGMPSDQDATIQLPSDPLAVIFPAQPLFLPSPPPTPPTAKMPTPTTSMQGSVTRLASEKNAAAHGLMNFTLDINQSFDTLCGHQLTISKSANGGSLQCTLGGVVVVDGEIYGMTVGHVFPLDHAYPASNLTSIITSETSQHEELEDSDCAIDTEEAFWFGLESGDDMSQQGISNPEHINNTPMQHMEEAAADNADETRLVAASGPDQLFSGQHDILNVFNKAVDQSDWALLHLPRTSSTFTNLKDPRNPWLKSVILGTVDHFPQDDVSVLFRDRSFSGVLRKSMSTILCEGRAYDVRLVVLNHILPRGSSGSWVVAGNRLCGHIIAVRENVPWAYMMPIGPIFEDIKRATGAREVGLFSPLSAQQEQSRSEPGFPVPISTSPV